MKFRFLCIFTITALLLFGANIFAASSNSVLVNVAPQNPSPYQDVDITLNSYANNLDSVLIRWTLNGKSVASGIGKKSFSLRAGAAGSTTLVTALIALPEGDITTTVTIKPSVMVLLWQANDSYVPPFYRGKALPTPDSEVKVVAMPEIASAKNMTYSWKKDYTNVVESSGYGKNFFLYTNDYLENSNNISVIASTVDQKSSSEASIDIGMAQPKILFYKNDNNLGTIWQNSLTDSYRVVGEEIVEAAPYFLSPKEIQNPRLIWNWFINDNQVSVQSWRKNFMPLKVEVGTHGTSVLKLEIENMDKLFGTASKEISVEF